MKIATYNLRNLFDEGPRQDYGKEIVISKEFADSVVSDIENVIATFAPNVLIVQEVGSSALLSRIAKKQGEEFLSFVATPDRRGIANGAIYAPPSSAVSLDDIAGIPVMSIDDTDALGKTLLPYRSFVYVSTEYNTRPLHIFGVHLKTTWAIPLRGSNDERVPITNQHEAGDAIIRAIIYRASQARRLRELIDERFAQDPDAQIIVLGDFNCTENSELLRIIMGDGKFPDTTLANLTETIPQERRFSFAGYGEKKQIDHILISKSLAHNVQNFEILNATIEDQSLFPEKVYTGSDHAPLVLTLN